MINLSFHSVDLVVSDYQNYCDLEQPRRQACPKLSNSVTSVVNCARMVERTQLIY